VYWPLYQDNFETQKEMVQRDYKFRGPFPACRLQFIHERIERAVWSVDRDAPVATRQLWAFFTPSRWTRTSFTLSCCP
jgi:hypothetical protein